MKWVHIDFWFRIEKAEQDTYLDKEQQKDFEKLLAKVIKKLKPKRKFYLWEPVPHCFLALQGVRVKDIAKVIAKIKRPYIDRVAITENPGDEGNGEGFLNVLNAMTDLYLLHRDNKLSHVIHCCIEFIFQSRHDENEFYQKMAIMYQEAKVIDGKKTYFYKEITPEVAKDLEDYRNTLDFRIK